MTLAGANPILESKQFNVVEKRLSTLTAPGVQERNLRPQIWAVAREVTAEHPFFGVGVNQFHFEARRRGLTEHGSPLENAHSIVFSLAAETGLIGLAAFLFFLGQIAVRAVHALRTSDRLRYALALGISAAMLGFALQGLTVVQIRVSFIAGTFFALAGMLTALADRAGAEAAGRGEGPARLPARRRGRARRGGGTGGGSGGTRLGGECRVAAGVGPARGGAAARC